MAGNFNEQTQEVRDLSFQEGISCDPPVLQTLGISNLIRRVWSTLFAKGTNGLIQLQATDDGRLKVASTSGGYSFADTIVAGGSDVTSELAFTQPVGTADFVVTEFPLTITTSPDGDLYGTSVTIAAGQTWSPPITILKFKIINSIIGSNGQLQAIGYY